MAAPSIAHTLVRADAARVRELARLCELIGVTPAAFSQLAAQLVEWHIADLEAERRDVVTLSAEDRDVLLSATARAVGYAAPEPDVQAALQQIHASFPATLTRAALARARRSAARLARFETLRGPQFTFHIEARVLLGAFGSATQPIRRPEVDFDESDGFHDIFVWGLELCAIREPGAAAAVDLGLGVSPAVAELLGVSGAELHELRERSHPFASYPFVPRGRFSRARGALIDTGPVGWAAGEEVALLARDFDALAAEQPAFSTPLSAVAARIKDAEAVVGLIELLPPESDGERQWLVEDA